MAESYTAVVSLILYLGVHGVAERIGGMNGPLDAAKREDAKVPVILDYQAPSSGGSGRISLLAVLSLVTGILATPCVCAQFHGGVGIIIGPAAAIVLGIAALVRITQFDGELRGEPFAVVAIALGVISYVLMAIVFFIAVGDPLR